MVQKSGWMWVSMGLLCVVIVSAYLAAFYYTENARYQRLYNENQQSLDGLSSGYDELMGKYNLLGKEYSILYGGYAFPFDVNFTLLMEPLGRSIDNLKANYSSILGDHKDLNDTYHILQGNYQEVYRKGRNITREDFGELLREFNDLFSLLTLRELGTAVSKAVTLVVSIDLDYGNGTIHWSNETEVAAGSSLFQLTQKIAMVDYTYYPLSKPGHVFIDAINDKEAYTAADFSEGWSWIWYYWDDDNQEWVSGMVGCDAWMLENSGIYKWEFEHWSWP